MAVFVYKGLDAAGNNTSGIIDADSPKLARMKLRKTGIFPTDLTEEHRERSAASVGEAVGEVFRKQFSFRQLLTRVTETDKAIVTRQLATLLGAGIPVVEALTALIDQVQNPPTQVALGQAPQRGNGGA